MALTVTWADTLTIAETLTGNTDSAPDATRLVTHTAFNEAATLTAATLPPVSKCACFVLALTAGAATVNLAALTGTNGATVDGTGLRLQFLRVKNLGANSMTIAPGVANGYDAWGVAATAIVTIRPGAVVTMGFNDGSPDIASGDRLIDVTGTLVETSEWTVIMG